MNINDAVRKITIDEMKSQIVQMKYGLIYEISNVIFDRMENIADIDWDEFVEGYFFDDKAQIHVYDTEDGLQAVCFAEPSESEFVDKEYELTGKYQSVGNSIKKREYLNFDEDGQVYVEYTRLVDVI